MYSEDSSHAFSASGLSTGWKVFAHNMYCASRSAVHRVCRQQHGLCYRSQMRCRQHCNAPRGTRLMSTLRGFEALLATSVVLSSSCLDKASG